MSRTKFPAFLDYETQICNCRLLWLFLCVGGVILCYSGMWPIYVKWQSNPTITSIATTNYPIWKINFPAVTVCSNNKVVKRKLKAAVGKKP